MTYCTATASNSSSHFILLTFPIDALIILRGCKKATQAEKLLKDFETHQKHKELI
jgi:hypothetical protein